MEAESRYKQRQPIKAGEVIKTAEELSNLYHDLLHLFVKHMS